MSNLASRAMSFLSNRRRAYVFAFGSPAGRSVLADLAGFCRAQETCVVAQPGQPVDRERTLILEGRREVWLRIQQHLNLTDEQIFALFTVQPGAADG